MSSRGTNSRIGGFTVDWDVVASPDTRLFHARQIDLDRPLSDQIFMESIDSTRPYKAQKCVNCGAPLKGHMCAYCRSEY